MKLLYINDELASADGSNSHALGLLHSFETILGKDNIRCFPNAEDGSGKQINHKAGSLKAKLKGPLQVVRYFRKKYLSVKRSKAIVDDLNAQGFVPTHVLARSTVFDTTAVLVAKAFHAKLIYEFNTPEYYERGIIKKEPLTGAIEKWEKGVIEASDYVYINSNICRDMICEHYGLDKKKFLVIPNGYMSELYSEDENEREQIREKVRTDEGVADKFVVTFVGSLKVWHGIKTFCETAALMEYDKDVVFLVLGDGEMHDMIADYVANHTNMIFKGKVNLETMKRYLYASDLGIMPYAKQDNFYYSPLKMFDMIGAGLPFIGTAVGQIEEFCRENGMENALVDNVSADTLAVKIKGLKENQDRLIITNKERSTWKCRAEQLIERTVAGTKR